MRVSADPLAAPRAIGGRAPDVFKPGGWVEMRSYAEDDVVDFVVIGTGAGGGPLIARLAEQGFSVIGFDAGPYFRPLEDFASDEAEQQKLYWLDQRIIDGVNQNGLVGFGTSSPFAQVSIQATANSNNPVLFAIGSTTAAGANSTLFSVSNTGSTTASNGINLTGGCFSINGACLASAATSSLATGFFAQGGNSFATTAVLGTNDNNALNIETNGLSRIAVDPRAKARAKLAARCLFRFVDRWCGTILRS